MEEGGSGGGQREKAHFAGFDAGNREHITSLLFKQSNIDKRRKKLK